MNLDTILDRGMVAVNLGAGGDADHRLPPALLRKMTVVEIDQADASRTQDVYRRKVAVQQAVAGERGRRMFRRNAFVGCSSLLPPKEEKIKFYGLQKLFTPLSEIQVETVTLPEILSSAGIDRVDFLKTDIEGADFEVIRSCEQLLPSVAVVQCELRFDPFYEGEPPLHEVATWLAARGFRLIGIKPEHWKPATPRRELYHDGVATWADCQFLNERLETPDGLAYKIARQVVALILAGRCTLADALVEEWRTVLPLGLTDELIALLGFAAAMKPARPSTVRLLVRAWRRRLTGRKSDWDFVVNDQG